MDPKKSSKVKPVPSQDLEPSEPIDRKKKQQASTQSPKKELKSERKTQPEDKKGKLDQKVQKKKQPVKTNESSDDDESGEGVSDENHEQMMQELREKDLEFEREEQAKLRQKLQQFVQSTTDKIWDAVQKNDPDKAQELGLSPAKVQEILKDGKQTLKQRLLEHHTKDWIEQGILKPEIKSQDSFCSKVVCFSFMVIFFLFMVFSKLNEESWVLFGMGSTKEFVDYYELLQVAPSASSREIKSQYRKLAAMYHPDRNRDNPSAKEMFLKLTEAGEVLGDPKKKEMYDNSQGMGNFKNYITSKTTELTHSNYDRLVVESQEFWIIQVYDHDSNNCASFQDTWENLAKKYPYFRFGRIDQRTQQKLLPRLPFKPLEFPFVFIYQPDMPAEFIEARRSADLVPQLMTTIKESLALRIKIIGVSELAELVKNGASQTHVIFINRAGFEDISFLYQSGLHHEATFMSTRTDLYGLVNMWFQQNYPNQKLPKYVLVKPGTAAQPEFLLENFDRFADRLKHLSPPVLSSDNLHYFCRKPNLSDAESLDSMCLLFPGTRSAAGKSLVDKAVSEITSLSSSSVAFSKLTIGLVNESSQPHVFNLLSHLAQKSETKLDQAAFAFHPETSRVLVIPDFKRSLQISGIEGLYEESLDSLNLSGHFSSELFDHVHNIEDLFLSNSYSPMKVNSG